MTERLAELTERLERTAARLRAGDLPPDEAAALIDDCARQAAEAAVELDRQVRAAADAPGDDQGSLLP
jgi:polyhydroxyalkanoate synthesis regulator phasin